MSTCFQFRTNKQGPLARGNVGYEFTVEALDRNYAWAKMCQLMTETDQLLVKQIAPVNGGQCIPITETKPHMWFLSSEASYFEEGFSPSLPAVKPFRVNLHGMVTTTIGVFAQNEDEALEVAKRVARTHVVSEQCDSWEVDGVED